MLRAVIASLLPAAALYACSASDPEAAIRKRLADAEAAAEARDTGFFRGLLAEGYRDHRGNDRDGMINTLRGYFLTHSSIEIVSRVDEVTMTSADAARAVVYAGMLGQRAGEPVLLGTEGELYRIEVDLVDEGGEWRVVRASWDRGLGGSR